jgi:hypothetical protein
MVRMGMMVIFLDDVLSRRCASPHIGPTITGTMGLSIIEGDDGEFVGSVVHAHVKPPWLTAG